MAPKRRTLAFAVTALSFVLTAGVPAFAQATGPDATQNTTPGASTAAPANGENAGRGTGTSASTAVVGTEAAPSTTGTTRHHHRRHHAKRHRHSNAG